MQDVKITVSPTTMKGLYTFGYRFYHEGQYDKASHFFQLLTCFGSGKAKYWKALGSSLQMEQKYELAAEAFASAAILNSEDPFVHLHAAECLFALEHWDAAENALSSVEKTCDTCDQKETLIEQVALLRSVWSDKPSRNQEPQEVCDG